MIQKTLKFFILNFQKKSQPILLGRWALKRNEKTEYYATLNANRDNCFKDYTTSKKKELSIEELIVFSHNNSYPANK